MLMVEGTHLSGTLPRVEKPKTIHTTHTRGIIILFSAYGSYFSHRQYVTGVGLHRPSMVQCTCRGRERLTARDTASVGQYPYVV